MLKITKHKWLKATAIIVTLAFLNTNISWAGGGWAGSSLRKSMGSVVFSSGEEKNLVEEEGVEKISKELAGVSLAAIPFLHEISSSFKIFFEFREKHPIIVGMIGIVLLSLIIVNMVRSKPLNRLIRALKNKDPRVRIDAVEELGKMGNKRAAEPLIGMLFVSSLSSEEENAIKEALVNIGDYSTAEILLNRFGNEIEQGNLKSSSIENTILSIVSEMGNGFTVEPLIRVVRTMEKKSKSSDARRKKRYKETMVKIVDGRARGVLKEALEDKKGVVREVAVEGLADLVRADDEQALPLLRKALRDTSPIVRDAAEKALKEIREKSVKEEKDKVCFIDTTGDKLEIKFVNKDEMSKRMNFSGSIGYKYLQEGKYQKAIENFTKGIEKDPYNDLLYNNRALAYERLGQHDKAVIDYNKAIKLNPHPLTYINRGVLYFGLKQYEKVHSDFLEGLKRAYGKGDKEIIGEVEKVLEANFGKSVLEAFKERIGLSGRTLVAIPFLYGVSPKFESAFEFIKQNRGLSYLIGIGSLFLFYKLLAKKEEQSLVRMNALERSYNEEDMGRIMEMKVAIEKWQQRFAGEIAVSI